MHHQAAAQGVTEPERVTELMAQDGQGRAGSRIPAHEIGIHGREAPGVPGIAWGRIALPNPALRAHWDGATTPITRLDR